MALAACNLGPPTAAAGPAGEFLFGKYHVKYFLGLTAIQFYVLLLLLLLYFLLLLLLLLLLMLLLLKET